MIPHIPHPIPQDIQFKAWILSMPIVTLDIETYYDDNIGFSKMTMLEYVQHEKFKIQGLSVSVNMPDGKSYKEKYFRTAAAATEYLEQIVGNLETEKWCMVGQNTKFDGYAMYYLHGWKPTVYCDTKAMSKGRWPFESTSLKNLAVRLWPGDPTKRKGDELAQSKGIWEWSDELHHTIGDIYCNNDVALTRDAFYEMLDSYPSEELEIIHITTRMTAQPGLTASHDILKEVLVDEKLERDNLEKSTLEAIELAIKEKGLDYWNPNEAEAKKKLPLDKKILTGRTRYIALLREIYELELPMKEQIRPKDNSKYMTEALAKNDPEYIQLKEENPDLLWLFEARELFASNQSMGRARRMMDVSKPERGYEIPIPLGYYQAHTGRYGGEEKLNFQNLGRGAKHRLALHAPAGFKCHVSDSSNVEARINAGFAQQDDLLEAFRNKVDVYSDFASAAFDMPVNKRDNPEERGAGKVCVLGLGYGMGMKTLRRTFATGPMGMAPTIFPVPLVQRMVDTYRSQNYMIVKSWKDANNAISTMIMLKPGEQQTWNCLEIEHERLRLPNGMYLNYPKLHYNNHFESFVYWNGMFWKRLYGGALIENIIQALARIVVMTACVNIDRLLQQYGGWIVMQVHDENIGIAKDLGKEKNDEIFNQITEIMRIAPSWMAELPLDAEGGYADNYSK